MCEACEYMRRFHCTHNATKPYVYFQTIILSYCLNVLDTPSIVSMLSIDWLNVLGVVNFQWKFSYGPRYGSIVSVRSIPSSPRIRNTDEGETSLDGTAILYLFPFITYVTSYTSPFLTTVLLIR